MTLQFEKEETVANPAPANFFIDFTFDWLDEQDINIYKNGAADAINRNQWKFITRGRVEILSGNFAANDKFKLLRETGTDDPQVTYVPGGSIRAQDLNDNQNQLLFVAEELRERYVANTGGEMTGNLELSDGADIVFEGSSHNTTIQASEPGQANTIEVPDASGTIALFDTDTDTLISSTPAELNKLDGYTGDHTDLNKLDGVTDGTVSASKVVIVDADKDITGYRNLTATQVTATTGTITTLNVSGATTANGNVTLGNAAADDITVNGRINSNLIPKTDDEFSLGSSDNQFKDLHINGTAEIDTLNSGTVDIDGGNIDGTAIGANSASTGVFTDLTGGNVQVGVTNDNEIDTSSGNLTIDSAGGTTTIDDELTVKGDATFEDDITLHGDGKNFIIEKDDGTDAFTVASNTGNTVITGTLNVKGAGDAVDIDNDLKLDGDLKFSAAKDVQIIDNSATALEIAEGSNNYVVFDTTNDTEKVKVVKPLEAGSTTTFEDAVTMTADNKDFKIQDDEGTDKFTVNSDTGNTSIQGNLTLASGKTGFDVEQLGDVTITSLADGEVLKWVAAESRWENKADSGGSGGGDTDLTHVRTDTTVTVQSSSGDNVTLPAANAADDNDPGQGAGIMSKDQATRVARSVLNSTPALHANLDINEKAFTDGDGRELLKFSETGSAVNELTIANAATGNAPTISSSGDNDNIGITLDPKGTGTVTLSASTTVEGNLTLNTAGADLVLTGTDNAETPVERTITIQAPTGAASFGSNYTLTLPINNGETSEFLQTNGEGVLSWQAVDVSFAPMLRNELSTDGNVTIGAASGDNKERNAALVGPYTIKDGEEILINDGSKLVII